MTWRPAARRKTHSVPDGDALIPDRFEPNDSPETAVSLGLQTTEADLTLVGDDVDYFTGYLKAGQIVQVETAVFAGLDTALTLYWQGELAAHNDDRSAADTSSVVMFTAPTDGWYVVQVAKATVYNGRYDLTTSLLLPTATPTSGAN